MSTTTAARFILLLALAISAAACLDAPSASPSPSPEVSVSPAVPSASASTDASASPSSEPSQQPSEAASTEPSASASTEGSTAVWWIDPAVLPLDPAATSFKAFVRETACASGQSPNGRVEIGAIRYAATTVTITIEVTPLPGGQDCQGNPDFPVTVTLSQAVGDRQVLDGGSDPPRDATTIPS